MNMALPAVLLPLLGGVPLAVWGRPAAGAWATLALNCCTFGLTLAVGFAPAGGLPKADTLGAIFGVLSGFVGITSAVANIGLSRTRAISDAAPWRVRHAAGQVMLGATLLGLYADNIGLLWLAVEAVTIAAVVGKGLPRQAPALAAAWHYAVLSAVGLMLGLFGTLLVYLAASPALGPGLAAMSFETLSAHADQLDGGVLTLAFMFLLFGYGMVAVLAPLATTVPGLLLNLPLIALLRFRHLVQANAASGGGAAPPGPLLLAFGLAALLLAVCSLRRRRAVPRFFATASIAHSGVAVFAFGLGGPVAIFGGLLHMILHTLLNSALFQALHRAADLRKAAGLTEITFFRLRGMTRSSKPLGWLLLACMFGLTGLPPSGLFVSEFLIVSQTIQRVPLLCLPLGGGLLLGAIAAIDRAGPMVFAPSPKQTPAVSSWATGFTYLHLMLMLGIAFAMPARLVSALSEIATTMQ